MRQRGKEKPLETQHAHTKNARRLGKAGAARRTGAKAASTHRLGKSPRLPEIRKDDLQPQSAELSRLDARGHPERVPSRAYLTAAGKAAAAEDTRSPVAACRQHASGTASPDGKRPPLTRFYRGSLSAAPKVLSAALRAPRGARRGAALTAARVRGNKRV